MDSPLILQSSHSIFVEIQLYVTISEKVIPKGVGVGVTTLDASTAEIGQFDVLTATLRT